MVQEVTTNISYLNIYYIIENGGWGSVVVKALRY